MIKKLFFISILGLFILPLVSTAQEAIHYQVPFVRQAPNGNWKDKVFADACEETSLIMAYAWIMGESLDPATAGHKLHEIASWEVKRFGFHQDTSVMDTYIIATEYLHLPASYQENISTDDIIMALNEKNLVIVPINAAKLYRRGPQRHMVLITGFDFAVNQFIYSDPMKANGSNLRISKDSLQSVLRDYPSGIHKAVKTQSTAMIKIPWPWVSDPI